MYLKNKLQLSNGTMKNLKSRKASGGRSTEYKDVDWHAFEITGRL
jgi:hypothetical protein